MSVLLLRLAAPLQAWGIAGRHNTRGTELAPTKSGVVGLLANALGRDRTDPVDDLAALRFGVRVDRPGELTVDYHTVSGASHAPANAAGHRLPTADGKRLTVGASTKVTHRYYLSDAVFVVGLEGERPVLAELAAALRRPRRPLYLGRRSCPPVPPLVLRLADGADLRGALCDVPSQRGDGQGEGCAGMPLILEEPGAGDAWQDQPLSFHPLLRRYAARPVRHDAVPGDDPDHPHDPFTLLTT
jgi:CRISPR system Cascade subunit CasD